MERDLIEGIYEFWILELELPLLAPVLDERPEHLNSIAEEENYSWSEHAACAFLQLTNNYEVRILLYS